MPTAVIKIAGRLKECKNGVRACDMGLIQWGSITGVQLDFYHKTSSHSTVHIA